MTAKNKPTYELFCKGIMNKSRKGVRFDADGNVIVEPKAEFGSDVEVDGQLTINSASDLKTKDGTTFKGDAGVGIEAVSLTDAKGLDFTMTDGTHLYTDSVKGPKGDTGATGPQGPKGDTPKLYRHTVCIINANAQLGPFALSFTAESEKNLEIDSIQDLISVFGNTSLSCNGFLWDSVSVSSAPYGAIVFRINIGTALASCTVDYYIFSQTDGPELTYGEEDSTLTDFIGTSGFTISDTVTAM